MVVIRERFLTVTQPIVLISFFPHLIFAQVTPATQEIFPVHYFTPAVIHTTMSTIIMMGKATRFTPLLSPSQLQLAAPSLSLTFWFLPHSTTTGTNGGTPAIIEGEGKQEAIIMANISSISSRIISKLLR